LATIRDNSNNTYQTTATFSFSKFGVSMSCGTKEKEGAIGAYAEFQVRVYNTGADVDTMSLSASSPKSWSAYIDPSTFTLSGGAYKDVKVQITVPSSEVPNSSDSIDVKCTSQASGKTDDILLTAVAVSSYNFQFKASGTVSGIIAPGGTSAFRLDLKNAGQQNDDYSIYVNEPPTGWSVTMSVPGGITPASSEKYLEYTVSVAKDATVTVLVNISVAQDPTEPSALIDVYARSLNDKFATEHSVNISLTTTIDWNSNIKFSGESTQTATVKLMSDLSYYPLEFKVSIKNVQSVAIRLTVTVQLDKAWESIVNPSAPTVEGGSSLDVIVKITPPKGAIANNYNFAIKVAENSASPKISVNLNGKVVIPPIHVFEWSVNKDTQTITEAGGKVTFKFTLANKGNLQTESVKLDLIADQKDGWSIKLAEESKTQSIIHNGNVTFDVTVSTTSSVSYKSSVEFYVKVNGTTSISPKATAKTDITPRYSTFFMDFFWIPIGLVVVIIVAMVMRNKQLK
jgi:uncharacterized membrane protein